MFWSGPHSAPPAAVREALTPTRLGQGRLRSSLLCDRPHRRQRGGCQGLQAAQGRRASVQVKGDPPSACVRGPGSQELILGAPEILSSACSLSSHRFTEFWWRRRELACLQSLADSNPECAVAPRLIDCSPQGIDGSSGRVLVMERVEGQTLRHILEDINGTRTGEGQSALLDLDSIRSALAPKTRLLLAPPVRGCVRAHATRAQHDHAEPLRRAGRPRLRRRRRLGARRRETGPPAPAPPAADASAPASPDRPRAARRTTSWSWATAPRASSTLASRARHCRPLRAGAARRGMAGACGGCSAEPSGAGRAQMKAARANTYVQSRFWRAPEVLLGIPLTCTALPSPIAHARLLFWVGAARAPADSRGGRLVPRHRPRRDVGWRATLQASPAPRPTPRDAAAPRACLR
jgi:hypothetical protein